jgi:hypothetical protein
LNVGRSPGVFCQHNSINSYISGGQFTGHAILYPDNNRPTASLAVIAGYGFSKGSESTSDTLTIPKLNISQRVMPNAQQSEIEVELQWTLYFNLMQWKTLHRKELQEHTTLLELPSL